MNFSNFKLYSAVFQLSISPTQFLKPENSCTDRNRFLSDSFASKNALYLWNCNNVHNILHLQETLSCLLHHLAPNLFSSIFIINNWSMLLVQLMEGKLPPLLEIHNRLMDVLHAMVCFMSLCLGYNFWHLPPQIFQVVVCVNVQESNHCCNACLDNHIVLAILCLLGKFCMCLLKFKVITKELQCGITGRSSDFLMCQGSIPSKILKPFVCGMYFIVIKNPCLVLAHMLFHMAHIIAPITIVTALLRLHAHVESEMELGIAWGLRHTWQHTVHSMTC